MTRKTALHSGLIIAIFCSTVELALGQIFKPTLENTYFPFELYKRETYLGKIQVDSFRLGYHSLMLRKFEEPKLFNSTDIKTIYRFTWLRSFDSPITTSLIVNADKIVLKTKIGNKANIDNSHFDLRKLNRRETERFYEYTNGKVDSLSVADLFQKGIYIKDTIQFRYITRTKELSLDEYQKFKNLIDEKKFWTYPTMGKTIFGADGADWILEGRDIEKDYHMIYRWSPNKDRDNEFKELCEHLITLTETTKKNRVY
jgi:hypothetical protein